MHTSTPSIILAACLLLSNSLSGKPNTSPQPTREITYKTIGDKELKLHVFDPSPNTAKPMPAIVFFFGGGWSGGTPGQFYHQSKSVLKVYDGPGHGFFNHGRDNNKWFLLTMTDSHKFLGELGWIEGDPAVEAYLGNPAGTPSGARTALFDGKTLNGWSVLKCEAEVNVGGIDGAKSSGLIKPDEWNRFKLTVRGANLALEINGKSAWKDEGLQGPAKGYIALQAEVPQGGQHRFRKIYITEL
jgi:hypothetical protein